MHYMDGQGIRRKIDDLGRVVIPAPMRKALSMREGDVVEVRVEGDRLVLQRAADRCAFCGATEQLEPFRAAVVCWSCTAALRALDRERTAAPANPFGF